MGGLGGTGGGGGHAGQPPPSSPFPWQAGGSQPLLPRLPVYRNLVGLLHVQGPCPEDLVSPPPPPGWMPGSIFIFGQDRILKRKAVALSSAVRPSRHGPQGIRVAPGVFCRGSKELWSCYQPEKELVSQEGSSQCSHNLSGRSSCRGEGS